MGLWLPMDVCPSARLIHMVEQEQTPQSPQRQYLFKHMVTAKQLSRKTDLGCLVLPAQLNHSAALPSAAAGSFWSGHVVALWQWDPCSSWRQMGVTQYVIYMLGCNPHHRLSCCSVTARSVLRLVFPLLASAGKDIGWTVGARFQGKGKIVPYAVIC